MRFPPLIPRLDDMLLLFAFALATSLAGWLA